MKGFEVGMRVLCIKDHSQNKVIKGQQYIVYAIMTTPCCGTISLDVGIIGTNNYIKCVCGRVSTRDEGNITFWVSSTLFIPAEEFKQVTYTKIIEEIPMGVN